LEYPTDLTNNPHLGHTKYGFHCLGAYVPIHSRESSTFRHSINNWHRISVIIVHINKSNRYYKKRLEKPLLFIFLHYIRIS
jgi:hypothetical protein